MSDRLDPEMGMNHLDDKLDDAQRAKLARQVADDGEAAVELARHEAVHQQLKAAANAYETRPERIPLFAEAKARQKRPHIAWRVAPALAGAMALLVIGLVIWNGLAGRPVEPLAAVDLTATARPLPTEDVVPTATPQPAEVPADAPTDAPTVVPSPTEMGVVPTESAPASVVSRAYVSEGGRVAYVLDGELFVEDEETDGFVNVTAEFDGLVHPDSPVWSFNGEQLAFTYKGNVSPTFNGVSIWHKETNTISSLGDLNTYSRGASEDEITEILLPFSLAWSPNGNKLLLTDSSLGTWIADFEQNELFQVRLGGWAESPWWINDEMFLLSSRAGMFCYDVAAYDLNRTQIWDIKINYPTDGPSCGTAGQFTVNLERRELINLHNPSSNETRKVDVIDLISGEATTVWEAPEDFWFVLGYNPYLSPDGTFIAFHYPPRNNVEESAGIQVIDRAGNWFGEVENVRLLDWRPSGGPVFAQTTETGQTQLLYWPLDGTMMRTFVFPSDFVFGSGRWSPDGRYFIYSAVDEEIDASYVYLWQPESGAPELLHADASELAFDGYVWLPDSSAVYFGLGQEKLLRYEVEEEVMLLAGEG